jgi:hypothetical protein
MRHAMEYGHETSTVREVSNRCRKTVRKEPRLNMSGLAIGMWSVKLVKACFDKLEHQRARALHAH